MAKSVTFILVLYIYTFEVESAATKNFSATEEIYTDLTRILEKSGFHRDLKTEFVLDIKSKPAKDLKFCTVLLVESFPSGVYIDKDEVDNFARSAAPTHFHYMTELETEKPSYQSQPTMVLVYTNFKGKSKIHFSLSFPIHFRYQLAHNTSQYTKIYIPPPLIYLSCNSERMVFQEVFHKQKFTKKISKGYPFHFQVIPKPTKIPLTLQVDFPVGKLSDERIVIIVTLLTTTIAMLLLISNIYSFAKRYKLNIVKQFVKAKKESKLERWVFSQLNANESLYINEDNSVSNQPQSTKSNGGNNNNNNNKKLNSKKKKLHF